MVFALQLWCHNELLDIVLTQRVAELCIAELGSSYPFLLFLHSASTLQRQPDRPFQVFIGDWFLGTGMHQFEQAANGLRHGVLVSAAECAAEGHPPLKG
jgi:hypothetical protein